MSTSQAREALFISHASPEDNAFALWIGAKLAALGYEVFADVLRLRGGHDWERILENAIREKAVKFLLVATQHGVQKQGVRNEITIAVETGNKLSDGAFIVPLRLTAFDAPLLIAHAQYIDFEKGWTLGLNELLALLSEQNVARPNNPENAEHWRSVQLKDARSISSLPEQLVSNWLMIDMMPQELFFYDFKGGVSIGAAQKAVGDCHVPLVPFNRGFLSFAPMHQLQDFFGPNLPIEAVRGERTETFLECGWSDLHILPHEARAKFTDLARRALDALFESKGLKPFELASGRLAWWPTVGRASMNQLNFSWPSGPSGRRQLVGRSEKRGFYWHYGVSCWTRSAPIRHVRVAGRVIFSSDGQNAMGDARRLHRMRRSFCKSWRNDKWRDLLLTFWYWLAEGAGTIDAPLGEGVTLRLRLPPMLLNAPFSVQSEGDAEPEKEEDAEDEDFIAAEDSGGGDEHTDGFGEHG